MCEQDTAPNYRRRRDDINLLKGLLHDGALPWSEQSPNALFVESGHFGSPYFIGRENFNERGQQMSRAPLSAKQIIDKIDAEERRLTDALHPSSPPLV